MALLDTEIATISEADRAANRVCPVTVKLTQDEHRRVTELAEGLGQARSEWIRRLILAYLQRANDQPQADPLLAEIIGVRLLLVNLLQPRDEKKMLTKQTFETLLSEIKRVKKQLAIEIERENERR
jgi:Ribbon-helix-helix protein, copG family